MHETAVAQSLVEVILQEAEKRHARPVRAKISCGELNAINDEVLSFALEAVAQGTPCEGLQLQVEHKSIQAQCDTCGSTFSISLAAATCPNCGSSDFKLLPDAPLILEQIEFEGAEDGEG
jgi:hydrogenase nickel incorporation protein HypA/HybF